MDLKSRIQGLANEKHITLAELERITGISNGQIRRWDKSSPKADNLKKVADYFGVTTDYLLGRETQNSPDWATEDDKIDLDEWLKSNVPMGFQGMDMDDETKIKVRAFLEGVFWED
ncbi:helix-turn-helix domain-containing protein, partial [Lactiplantibacillus plantarum]